jgi:TolB protein
MQPVCRRLTLSLGLIACLTLCLAAAAQVSPDTIQVYTTGPRTTFVVAVPDFDAGGGALPGQNLSAIVMNDLKLSGFFRPPDNPTFARETHQLDRKDNTIHFAEWHRIGVSFLVRGQYTVQNGELEAEVKTYDTVSQNYVFGKKYRNYSLAQARRLAHQLSDDIIKRLLDNEGNSRGRMLFVRQLDPFGKTKQTCVMDADGFGVKELTPVGELTATPAWGARGTEVYYTTYKDFNPDLAGLILSSDKTWWISRRTGFNLSPAWNEQRQLIALTLTKDGNSELYTIQRDGQNPQRLTNNRAIDSSPTWSRDGRKIAFTSDRTGSPQIWVKNLDGGNETRLTFHSSYNDAAAWSPAGPDRISFCSRVDDHFQIFSCNPDGSDLTQLTSGSDNNEDPTWAPNGLELAFTSDRTGRKQIFRMFADGGNMTQLTNDAACQSPAWSPLFP